MSAIYDYMVALQKCDIEGMMKAKTAVEAGVSLRKAAISGATIEPGGTLTEAASKKYFDNITNDASFLGQVTTERLTHIKQNMDYFAFASDSLVRVAEGTAPSAYDGITTTKKTWELLSVQKFSRILFQMLENKIQSVANMDSYLFAGFTQIFRNDLLKLSIQGDITNGATDFLKLNDGWIELSRDAVNGTARDLTNSKAQRVSHGTVTGAFIVGETVTGDTSGATGVISVIGSGYLDLVNVVGTFEATTPDNISGGTSSATADLTLIGTITTDYITTMDNMLAQLPNKWSDPGMVKFIMAPKDKEAWEKQVSNIDGLTGYVVSGAVPTFRGYKIETVSLWPTDTFVLTNPKNFGFAMGRQMQSFRDIKADLRCIDWTWNLYHDAQVYVDDMIVLSD